MIPFETPESLPGKHLETYEQALALGENYEQTVADQVTALGLPAYRLRQRFLTSDQLWENRYHRLRGKPERHTKDDPRLLRPYQVDLAIRLDRTRRALVEVKCLSPAAFGRPLIHIGLCEKYDRKLLPISAVILVNRKTRESWAIPFAPEEWTRRRSIWSPQTFDYAVRPSQMSPLEAWVDYLKDSLVTP